MSQKITSRHIANAMLTLLKEGASSHEVAQSTAAYLITECRSKDYNAVIRDLLELLVAQGTVEAVATSAFDLAETVKREIQTVLEAQFKPGVKINLYEEHDPDLIGGVRIEAPDVQLDLSIKHRLQQLATATQVA